MIRNVVLCRLASDATAAQRAQLRAGLAGIAALDLPGMVANHVGVDAGLRAGGWSAAITNDWIDADAYRRYDADPEHNRHRAAIVEACAEVARVQLEIDPSPSPHVTSSR